MKLLLFSDLHGDIAAARRIAELARDGGADAVIGAGDFGNGRRGVGDCIPALSEIAAPAVLVPGNNESFEELQEPCRLWKGATVLHGTGTVIGGTTFWGVGGGIPVTPFGDWSYDFAEDEAQILLAGCPAGAVLVAHSPPAGVVDVSSSGRHLGSEAVRDAVVRIQPRLVVCGHIHASGGQTGILADVTIVNAGPAGVWFDLAALP